MKDINEKQIEEMTNEVKKFKERTRFLFGWDGRPKDEIFATLLLEAGYRKQSDTVWEFVKKVKETYDKMDRLYRDYDIIALWSDIIRLAVEYGALAQNEEGYVEKVEVEE